MKRVAEKVKDIVEICPFTHLHDFAADPALTLTGYHFTDITADLMSKWLDSIAAVKPGHGAALALAGFRGVGKSHFLSALGVILSRPELRTRISDAHVASCAERLSRRHGTVALVRRGFGTSLLDELKSAVGQVLSVNPGTLSDSLYDLLLRASEHAGDLPLVLLIDTALGRETRVTRDDGTLLSEIAEAAKTLGIFTGVALDDDISGADGPNASIAANFSIDYLDQEHLYKIVDSVVFSKHSRMLPILHDIYEDYRAAFPAFRWSEQRFKLLYPLHPATVEVAPLIRLYIHDFGLLGFAAEAGVKILGRPANSLIGLDEVFDSVETKLRQVPDLRAAFASFDRIESEVLLTTPVRFRHPARLILKGLFMLSLNGVGTSANELAAAMMIQTGNPGDDESLDISGLLDLFASTLPGAIEKDDRDPSIPKFRFRLTEKFDVDAFLNAAMELVSEDGIWNVLINQTAEKFADFDPSGDEMSCAVAWRGSSRQGSLVVNIHPSAQQAKEQMPYDWRVSIERNTSETQLGETGAMIWSLAELSESEKDALRRYHALQNDTRVREHLADSLATTLQIHAVALEKIWQRVFLTDSVLVADEKTYAFTDDALSAHTLAHLFEILLKPVFEIRFPEHPDFGGVLREAEVANSISSFFAGSVSSDGEGQMLAESFAYPLGLATKVDGTYLPSPLESLLDNQVVRLAIPVSPKDSVERLDEIYDRMSASPVGLTRPAVHLVLAALVAQRYYEFVTSSGNRINYRSLDLQVIWDDIVGVARPQSELYPAERLLLWAKLITGNSALRSLDRSEDRLLIIDSLSGWLTGWNEKQVLVKFDALPDECLNAGIWRTAANLRKSFGSMVETIASLIRNDCSLDECLNTIADLFSDSEEEFERKRGDLRVLSEFTDGVSKRDWIVRYLSLSEITDNAGLEGLRLNVLEAVASLESLSKRSGMDRINAAWAPFKDAYIKLYAEKHDLVTKSSGASERLRQVLTSDRWSMFESLSSFTWLEPRHFAKAKELIREIRRLHCGSDVFNALDTRPFCGCSFSLTAYARLIDLPDQLERTIDSGLASYKSAIIDNASALIDASESDAMRASIKAILAGFQPKVAFPSLTIQDVRILKIAGEYIASVQETLALDDPRSVAFDDYDVWQHEVERVVAFVNTDI